MFKMLCTLLFLQLSCASVACTKFVGKASWYGKQFHNRRMANGERFNMFRLTCAHKYLPLGTKLLIKNRKNGKKVIVTVKDRGPYIRNRVLDLSYGAAKKLDMVHSGVIMVEALEL